MKRIKILASMTELGVGKICLFSQMLNGLKRLKDLEKENETKKMIQHIINHRI